MYMPTLTVDNFLSPWGCVGGVFCTSVHTWLYRESMGTKPWLDSWLYVCVCVCVCVCVPTLSLYMISVTMGLCGGFFVTRPLARNCHCWEQSHGG